MEILTASNQKAARIAVSACSVLIASTVMVVIMLSAVSDALTALRLPIALTVTRAHILLSARDASQVTILFTVKIVLNANTALGVLAWCEKSSTF